jgi:hypothetical protein
MSHNKQGCEPSFRVSVTGLNAPAATVNPEAYLADMLQRMPAMTTQDDLGALLPSKRVEHAAIGWRVGSVLMKFQQNDSLARFQFIKSHLHSAIIILSNLIKFTVL